MTKKQRERVKQHELIPVWSVEKAETPWINDGAVSDLWRCSRCDWLGWFPIGEVRHEQNRQA